MSESYTASFHNGGMEKDGIDSSGRKRKKLYQACREHNIRDPRYCDKQDHIVKGGLHETWIDVPPMEAYEQIFGEAFREYNGKQRKKERQFNSYWEKVKKSKDLVPVREALITIGNVEQMPAPEVQKEIYKAFLEEFQKQNPNMKVIGAYYHADEMRKDGNGGFVKGAPHMHLDYIPVAYNCKRGQKIQNSMNSALLEQGIMNIEIDPEVAEKKFGKREKLSKTRAKTKVPKAVAKQMDVSASLKERMKCIPKLDEENPEAEPEKITKTRMVTNLIQWTQAQRNLLMKIAREHGLTIENPNEKRDHLSTEDYIYSKDPSLKSQVYGLGEKLLTDVKEVDSEKVEMVEWHSEVKELAESADEKMKEAETQKQKNHDYFDYKNRKNREWEKDLKEQSEALEKEKSFFANAKKHVSESLHKFVQKLKKKKKEVEEKDKALDKALEDVSKLAERAQILSQSSATRYEDFEDDIQFKDARKMAFSRDGNGLCQWFTNVDRKFSAWLHKADYFIKHFWNKTPDDLITVAEDMRNSYCRDLSEYIEKGMRGNTLSQIKEAREIKEEVPKIRETVKPKQTHTRKEIDWWD